MSVKFPVIFFLIYFISEVKSGGLKEEYTWTFINYAWPENNTVCQPKKPGGAGYKPGNYGQDFVFPSYHQAPIRNYFRLKNRFGQEEETPEYNSSNNIPMGATRYKNRLFITVPRRRIGIPATLSYVDLDCPARHNVPLTPYPNWEINSLSTSRPEDPASVETPFVSVYRTTVDECDRLWFVDMGILEYPTGRQQLQQFAIVVVDLKTDKVIRRYPLPVSVANPQATLASVTVDVNANNCDDAYAYIPDLVNYKLIVYSWRQSDSWLVNHNYFAFDPTQGDFDIGGHQFMWNDGIFSITLSKINKDGFKTAFFHPMASTKEFAVNTKILKDRHLATRPFHGQDFKTLGNRGPNGQSSTHELHQKSGVLLMGEVSKNGLFCWNINKPLTPENQGMIHADEEKMIYPSDVKIDQQDNVWMMTNSMPRFLYGSLNYEEVNFRVWTNSIRDAVSATVCAHK